MTLKALVVSLAVLPAAGCATHQIARDVKLLSLTSEPSVKEVSYGNIQGKSCQWNVLGHAIGQDPSIRLAFENAAKQKDGGAITGLTKAEQDKPILSVIKNVSTGSDYLGLYLVGRNCVTVEGLGYL